MVQTSVLTFGERLPAHTSQHAEDDPLTTLDGITYPPRPCPRPPPSAPPPPIGFRVQGPGIRPGVEVASFTGRRGRLVRRSLSLLHQLETDVSVSTTS